MATQAKDTTQVTVWVVLDLNEYGEGVIGVFSVKDDAHLARSKAWEALGSAAPLEIVGVLLDVQPYDDEDAEA